MDQSSLPSAPPSQEHHDSTTNEKEKKQSHPKLHLIISNISKKNNIRSLLLTAASFQCHTVFLAGQPSFNISTDLPKQLLLQKNSPVMNICHYPNLTECIEHIRQSNSSLQNVKIVGVEITDQSKNLDDIDDAPFHHGHDVVFMMGNEGTGMSKPQMAVCDEFIKIRQFGNGTASLNVNVAAGVVLHSFDIWRRKQV